MSPKAWIEETTIQLDDAGVSSPRLDAQIMIETVLERDRASLGIDDESHMSTEQASSLHDMVERRLQREPLAYILGSREFYGLEFKVDNTVLVPRPETEVLVEYCIENAPKNGTVLELGTGSGAIALALKNQRDDLNVSATDVSAAALATAQANAKNLKLDVTFIEANLFEGITGEHDVVLANLPYVPEPARRQPEIEHEPDIALYGGEDGLDFYRTYFEQLSSFLKPDGFSVVEFSPTQFAAVRELANDYVIEPLSEYIYLVKR